MGIVNVIIEEILYFENGRLNSASSLFTGFDICIKAWALYNSQFSDSK